MQDNYDILLIKGLTKLKEIEFSFVPNKDEIEYTFSDKYIKSKKQLLKRMSHSYWKYTNTVAKKVAVIIITLILTFSSLMSVDAIREKLLDFVFNIYSTFTVIKSNTAIEKSHIDTYYTLSNIPEEFNVSLTNHNSIISTMFWTNKKEQDIVFTQSITAISSSLNSEHGKLNETIINNTPCLTCKNDTNYFCYWEFDGFRFELVYPIDLGEEYLREIIGKLVKYTPEDIDN